MLTHLDETQAMLRDAARGFCVKQEARRAAPRQALWTALAAMGWTGVTLPAALGGSESTAVEAGVIAFEMGRSALFTSYPESVALQRFSPKPRRETRRPLRCCSRWLGARPSC